jgi:hypothetical protein
VLPAETIAYLSTAGDCCTAGFQRDPCPLWVSRVRSIRSLRSRHVRFAPESGHRPTRWPLHSCVWDASDSRARIEWQVLASQRLAPFRSRARAWGGRLWQGLRVSPQRRGASPLADGESAKTAIGTPILWEFLEAATAQPTVVPMEGRGPYRVSGAHRPLHSCHGTSVPVEEPSTASIADIRGL